MKEQELWTRWVAALLSGLDGEVEDNIKPQVMEYCGRACAVHHGDIDTVKAIRSKVKDVDELLHRLNQQEGLWCGKWVRDGDTICSICQQCGCRLVRAGLVKPSPTFCQCSRGWVKAVFETALGRPVNVKLRQAIGRGDPVCKFIVS